MVIYDLFVGGCSSYKLYPFLMEEYPRKLHLRALGSSLSLDCMRMWMKDTYPNIFWRKSFNTPNFGVPSFCYIQLFFIYQRVLIPLKLGKDLESTSIGDLKSRTQEDIQFFRNVAIKMASPQYEFETFIWKSKDLVTSNTCLLLFSTTLSCCGVFTHEDWCAIPSFWR